MITTVLAECPECKKEVDAKVIDCDNCREGYIEAGGDPDNYSDLFCSHVECMHCETRIF